MKSPAAVGIPEQSVAFLIHAGGRFLIFCRISAEIIFIDKIISRIIGRIDIYDFYLLQITLLQKLENVKIIALEIEILCTVPVDALFSGRTQCLLYRFICIGYCLFLSHPVKLV